MATTYELISSQTLGSDTATVTFSSIPGTYDDLIVVFSARSTRAASNDPFSLQFNSDTGSNYSWLRLEGSGSAASSGSGSSSTAIASGRLPANSATADTYGSYEIYIPNYTGSTNKSVSITGAEEQNQTTAFINATAGLWSDTSAISGLSLFPANGNFKSGSSFYLYGIKRSS